MKKWGLGLAVGVVVAAAVVLVVLFRPDPTGRATGSRGGGPSEAALTLWADLQRYETPYLAAFAERFEGAPDDALEVLVTFQELVCAVTGFGGLWRKTVPGEYFGCNDLGETPICQKLASVQKNFTQWDALQEQIMAIDDARGAETFLAAHLAELQGYLRTYVPSDRSLTAIQATPFFAEQLAMALEP